MDISFTVCLFVCTVTDFSAEDKASGFEFCTAVCRRPGQEILHFGEPCFPRSFPRSPKLGHARWSARWPARAARALADSFKALATRRIGMCGYTVPENGRTSWVENSRRSVSVCVCVCPCVRKITVDRNDL